MNRINKFNQVKQFYFIFLTATSLITAQENHDQINYLEDSFYTAIKEIIESDTSQCYEVGAMITLKKAAELDDIKRKDDTLFIYTKQALNKYPHEISNYFFWMDSFFTIHVKNSYSRFYPKTYKYMRYVKDSIEKNTTNPCKKKSFKYSTPLKEIRIN